MREKIEWYQEVLSLEPGSKVFFALAKLFVETGQLEPAVRTLRQGLDRHPDFMEARLLLSQVLIRLGRHGDAAQAVEPVAKTLKAFPDFWRLWAQASAGADRDFAVFLMLAASHFTSKPLQWMDVLLEGVNSLSARLVEAGPVSRPAEPAASRGEAPGGEESLENGFNLREAGSLRTRTMADLLASQGDFAGARDIYRELRDAAESGPERDELNIRLGEMEAELRGASLAQRPGPADEDAFSRHAKNRLIGTLEALAARFEARVRT